MMRLVHTQVWPELRNFEAIAPVTARSMSASSKTTSGALPPSSIDTRFNACAARPASTRPTSVEPVKVILRTAGFSTNSSAIGPAAPVTMLTTPAGTPALFGELAPGEAGIGGGRGRLDHRGAAGGERRAELAADHRRREVPRRDRRDDADRLLDHHDATIGPGRRDGVAIDAARLFGEPLDVAGRAHHLALGFRQRLALLEGEEFTERIDVLADEIGEPMQDDGAFGRGLGGPGRERGFGGGDGARHFAAPDRGDDAEGLRRSPDW